MENISAVILERVNMAQEKSAGAIVYRREGKGIKYLLLHYKNITTYWDFPRGNVEAKESEHDAALREIEEETGISDVVFVDGFAEKVNWFYKKGSETVFKEVVFFLAVTEQKEVKISKEHIGYAWLSYENAKKKVKFENTRKVLRNAHKFLIENG